MTAGSQARADRVRLMTWNVWWRFGPAWAERQPRILQTLRDVDADVVALQEVWVTSDDSQADEFARELGLHAAVAVPSLPPPPKPPEAPDQDGVLVGLAILSRWEILEALTIEMPSRHRDPRPVMLQARIAHPHGPIMVTAVCLEWEPAYNDDRLAQGLAVAEAAFGRTFDGFSPSIAMGDFNAAPESPVLAPLHETAIDVWAAAGGSNQAATLPGEHPHAPLEARELLNKRIDHIFIDRSSTAHRIRPTSAQLAGARIDGIYPSDHRAVVCELLWD